MAGVVLPYQNQQLSTTFGGPIVRDRIHYFLNYEFEREPKTYTYTSPFQFFNINQQFPLVHQTDQLQIAPGTNFRIRNSTGIEFNVNLPIVQAPFRIYWAYNPLRIHDTIVAPPDQINLQSLAGTCQALGLTNPLHPNQCDPSILSQIQPSLQNPGRLHYFEPVSTFRFTTTRSQRRARRSNVP